MLGQLMPKQVMFLAGDQPGVADTRLPVVARFGGEDLGVRQRATELVARNSVTHHDPVAVEIEVRRPAGDEWPERGHGDLAPVDRRKVEGLAGHPHRVNRRVDQVLANARGDRPEPPEPVPRDPLVIDSPPEADEDAARRVVRVVERFGRSRQSPRPQIRHGDPSRCSRERKPVRDTTGPGSARRKPFHRV